MAYKICDFSKGVMDIPLQLMNAGTRSISTMGAYKSKTR